MTDYSFELDDDGVPYWVITTYKNRWLFSLPEASGVAIVNATTGETNYYDIDHLPEWVDRVQPEEFIMQQIQNQGPTFTASSTSPTRISSVPARATSSFTTVLTATSSQDSPAWAPTNPPSASSWWTW